MHSFVVVVTVAFVVVTVVVVVVIVVKVCACEEEALARMRGVQLKGRVAALWTCSCLTTVVVVVNNVDVVVVEDVNAGRKDARFVAQALRSGYVQLPLLLA